MRGKEGGTGRAVKGKKEEKGREVKEGEEMYGVGLFDVMHANKIIGGIYKITNWRP